MLKHPAISSATDQPDSPAGRKLQVWVNLSKMCDMQLPLGQGCSRLLCLQEKLQLINNRDESPDSQSTTTDAARKQHVQSTSLLQRLGMLQHLAQSRQRAAAIKSTTAAVQDWFEQQQGQTAQPLPADAVLMLNQEAEKGLLHMLSVGLIPCQLELSPGLCGGADGERFFALWTSVFF